MRHYTTFFILLILAVIVSLTGCKKDNYKGMIALTAEGYDCNEKTAVSDYTTTWMSGDVVSLNGVNCTVSVNSDNAAYVNAPESVQNADIIYGYTPASIVSTYSGTTTQTVTIPSAYLSSFSGGKQIISMPMAARADGTEDGIKFSHLTAAVKVRVKNLTGYNIYLDSIVLATASCQLSGDVTVDFNASSYGIVANESGVAPSDKRVKVYFESESVSLSNEEIKDVLVPVLPLPAAPRTLNVLIYTHRLIDHTSDNSGLLSVNYSYDYYRGLKSSNLPRNRMAIVQIAVTTASDYVTENDHSLFTVAVGQKARFSKGNLQYQPSTSTWRFADNQYTVCGNENGNVSQSYTGWIDIFGWATSGYNNGATCYMPYETSTTHTNYYNGGNLVGNLDWGYNAISNGGNAENSGWKTPSGGGGGEWKHMMESQGTVRTVKSYGLPSGTNSSAAKYTKATVVGVSGVILFPDVYRHPSDVTVTGSPSYNTETSAYTSFVVTSAADWLKMEKAGCVFLPAAGQRINGYNRLGSYGRYQSSTNLNSSMQYALSFTKDGDSYGLNASGYQGYKGHGYSVRLIKYVVE